MQLAGFFADFEFTIAACADPFFLKLEILDGCRSDESGRLCERTL
jgi:hypothetical protein